MVKEPKITTNELARMMVNGFNELGKQLNDKIDSFKQELNDKIDSVDKRLSDKIDSVDKRLSDKIDSVEYNLRLEMRNGFAKVNEELADIKIRLDRLEKRSFEDDEAILVEVNILKKRVNWLEAQVKKIKPA